MGGESLHLAPDAEARDGLDGHVHLLPDGQAGDVGLVDVRVDDEVAEVGDAEDLGAGVEPARPADGLADGHGPGQDRAVEGRGDTGAAEPVHDEIQGLLGAVEAVLGEVELGPCVLEQFLGDEAVGEEILGALELAFGLAQLEPGTFDGLQLPVVLDLQVAVVELEEQGVLLDGVAHVHGQVLDLAVDLGAYGHLLGRADVAGGGDGEADGAGLDDGRGGAPGVGGCGGCGGEGRAVVPQVPTPAREGGDDEE